jgi:hypothetical protein
LDLKIHQKIFDVILSLYKFEPKQKYLADQSDESGDDFSDSGDEEDYGVQTYNPYIPDTPNLPDLETLTQPLDLISQLDYVFAATVPDSKMVQSSQKA